MLGEVLCFHRETDQRECPGSKIPYSSRKHCVENFCHPDTKDEAFIVEHILRKLQPSTLQITFLLKS